MMTKKLDIAFHVQNPVWKVKLRPYTKTVQEVLEAALAEWVTLSGKKSLDTSLRWYDKKGDFEIAVVLADDDFVQNLNKQYRGKDKPTNVLSFPDDSFSLSPKPQATSLNLGDIILAFETIEKEATEQQKTFRNHSKHLLVHGFLHLLGYDHIKDKDAEIMEKLEIKILKKLGISNPYL